jgi:ubiquinone/menaquinone biosynthesis C-methylase UbiE
LLQTARRRADEAGLEIDWLEGDAEQLPFPDGSFERVLSCFGTMFAPRHEQAAAELLRVARRGGTVGVCAWTPEGVNGQMFALMGSFMPSPPDGFQPPVLWGNEEHMRKLLDRESVELSFERRTVYFEQESVEAWIAYGEQNLGPAMMAKRALEPQGRYEELRGKLAELYERNNMSRDGGLRFGAEYLLTLARLPA